MFATQRSLVRAASTAATRATPRSTITNVRHFRQSAPVKYTENKQVSGLAGVIEADNATFSVKALHYSSVALMGLTPVAFVLSPSPLAIPVDFALGVLFPLHAHIGMNNVISDYVPKSTQTLARIAWLGVTGVMLLGFLRVNIEGAGITETVKTVWRESPNKKQLE